MRAHPPRNVRRHPGQPGGATGSNSLRPRNLLWMNLPASSTRAGRIRSFVTCAVKLTSPLSWPWPSTTTRDTEAHCYLGLDLALKRKTMAAAGHLRGSLNTEIPASSNGRSPRPSWLNDLRARLASRRRQLDEGRRAKIAGWQDRQDEAPCVELLADSGSEPGARRALFKHWPASSIRRRNPRDCATTIIVLLPLSLDIEFLLLAPDSTAPFPLSLSPSIVSLYSTVISYP